MERVLLTPVEQQALHSIILDVERLRKLFTDRAALQETIIKNFLEGRGYHPDCWVDVTNVEHGVIRISAEDPNEGLDKEH